MPILGKPSTKYLLKKIPVLVVDLSMNRRQSPAQPFLARHRWLSLAILEKIWNLQKAQYMKWNMFKNSTFYPLQDDYIKKIYVARDDWRYHGESIAQWYSWRSIPVSLGAVYHQGTTLCHEGPHKKISDCRHGWHGNWSKENMENILYHIRYSNVYNHHLQQRT